MGLKKSHGRLYILSEHVGRRGVLEQSQIARSISDEGVQPPFCAFQPVKATNAMQTGECSGVAETGPEMTIIATPGSRRGSFARGLVVMSPMAPRHEDWGIPRQMVLEG